MKGGPGFGGKSPPAAQQVWPQFDIRPQTARSGLWARSASSSTMMASLPPSSIDEG